MRTNNIKSIDPNAIPQAELHAYLISAVAPRPICFASTIDKEGRVNLSPFSFFNVFSSNPPIMVFSPARRGRDKSNKHTFDNIVETKETVINIINYPLVEQMSLASTEYDRGVNEFVKAGLTQVESDIVGPPRVGEAPVAFECTVDQVIELGTGGGAGNLVIVRVVMIHIQKSYFDESGKLDTHKLDLVARMGGSWYSRANGDSLFEIPKPLRTRGIGIDQLPLFIRNSHILSANNLGRLGNVESLPDLSESRTLQENIEVKSLIEQNNNGETLKTKLHLLAQQWLETGKTKNALQLLILAESL